MSTQTLVKMVFDLLEDIDKHNNYHNCSPEWKQEKINEKLHAMVGPLALLGDHQYFYPHEENWEEVTAMEIVQSGPRKNPALYQSALKWLCDFGSKETKFMINSAYSFAEEAECEFYDALSGIVMDQVENGND